MFLTNECDYALRIVRGLADMELRSVSNLCAKEKVPQPFAYKVLKKMERAGIVSSRRGPTGGYKLAKSTDNLTILDIVKAVDDHLFLNECLKPGIICVHHSNGSFCGFHKELIRCQEQLVKTMSEKSIKEIL
jgi:Rrf2 family protein